MNYCIFIYDKSVFQGEYAKMVNCNENTYTVDMYFRIESGKENIDDPKSVLSIYMVMSLMEKTYL